MTPTHRCSIIPPYLLEALMRSPEPAVAGPAETALRHDTELRASRRTSPGARRTTRLVTARVEAPTRRGSITPGAASNRRAQAPRGVGPAPQRTISDAGRATITPGEQVRSEGAPAVDDPATNEAYDGLGATWELYWNAYGRDSLDGKGMPLLATVHYGTNYDNAFWDNHQMVFGDGDGIVFLRFTKSLDVIGHELTHGVTEHTAGLLYEGQSGALNESLSDVFGVLVKQRALSQSGASADWLVGADLLAPGVKARALRDMQHPGTAYDDPRLGKDPQPAHMDDYVVTRDDNGGVHVNSGIPNRAFVLAALAIGGNAWESAGQIWYAVLDGPGIKADCDFETFAELTVSVAVDRHGGGSIEHKAVRQGWVDVGVLIDDAAGVSDSSELPAGVEDPGERKGPVEPKGPADSGAGEAPTGPAPADVPPVDAQVSIRRTGGFAGLVRERHLALRDLAEQDTRDWQHLLAARTLQRLARQAKDEQPTPDTFCYSVVCDQVDVDVTVAEPHLPEAIQSLFERTLADD